MRYLISLLLAGALLGTSAAFAQITIEKSEVTGVKRIESDGMRSLNVKDYEGNHASFRAAHVDDPDEGISWVLSFYGFTDEKTQVSRTNKFFVQADGQRLEPIRLESKTRKIDGSLIEIKRATMPRSAFELIAAAQNVTISVGGAQFSAIKPRREDLRRILDEVGSDTRAPQTASSADNR